MDRTDIEIVNILQANCKTTTRDIGQAVGLTAPAVSERITRLRETGVIQGYHAQINPVPLGKHLSAFITVNVEPKQYEAFCKYVLENPYIVEHHHIIGPNNALLKIQVADANELEAQLSAIRTYGLSQTSVLLKTYFASKPF